MLLLSLALTVISRMEGDELNNKNSDTCIIKIKGDC